MHVHIITDRPSADRILPRLSRYLAEGLGWTLSPEPDPKADINYFMNYIWHSQKSPNWHETKMGAYFSHREKDNLVKAGWWDKAAEEMDFCTATAKKWANILPSEKTYMVAPPVEVDKFNIVPKEKSGKLVVGITGFVTGDDRKGESLVKRLLDEPVSRKVTLKAIGRGWPLPYTWCDWFDIHKFYQGLDILFCPSMLEGVPMPPLEALACGKKIVIPHNIGMLDDLPNILGIYRYTKGDVKSAVTALEEAMADSNANPTELRRIVTERYTVQHWLNDHAEAVMDFYYTDPPTVEPLPDWRGNSGVYMVAFGEPSRRCAKQAIKSINKYMPDLPVALVSPEPLGPETIWVEHEDVDVGGRIAKLKADILSPQEWDYVLYLDADIELMGDISFLFHCLHTGWEFVICKDMQHYATANMMKRPDNQEECEYTWQLIGTHEHAFQYNGGLMAFRRNERTKKFFELWREEYQRWAARDQGALLRALYLQPLKTFMLFNQWNASDRYDFPPGEIAVVHHNTYARRWVNRIEARLDSETAWESVRQWQAKYGDKSPGEVGKI